MITVRVLSSLALASTLEALAPAFAAEGLRVEATLMPTALLLPRIRAGERGDVAILMQDGIEALLAEGVLVAGSRVDLARSRVGVAVRAGAARPAIGTEAELVSALLSAERVGLSRAGASGLFFAGLLDRLGIAEPVMAKAVVIESGYTGALLAEGRVTLAVQQVSELMMVPGVDVVGALPLECGGESVLSGGMFVGGQGAGVLSRIAGAQHVLRAHGLAPA